MKSVRAILVSLVLGSMGVMAQETVKGRYVQILLPRKKGTLSLAEVQVFSGGKNVALKKKAKQSNTGYGGDASRAVDGKTSGDWGRGSITHTAENQANMAWEVDLGKDVAIERISLWNRDGFESRLDGFYAMVLDSKRKVVWGATRKKAGKGEIKLTVAGAPKFTWLAKVIPPLKAAKISSGSRGGGSRLPMSSANFLSPEENGGVRNGPLMKGGLKTSSQGAKESLKLAIEHLTATYGAKYPKGEEYLSRLAKITSEKSPEFAALKREALLANPLLAFDKVLLVRCPKGNRYSANWTTRSNCQEAGKYADELVVLSIRTGQITTIYKPGGGKFIGDVDLHFNGDKILFSSHVNSGELKKVPNTKKAKGFAVYEMKINPKTGAKMSEPRRVTPDMGWDVDSYDACYLPDGRVIFASTASYEGVPCVGGNSYVANLYLTNPDGTKTRRLTFDQDASWHPSVMENGRVMYVRWEYTDSAHYFSRVLMTMNPDGSDQKAYYGSNSYWPNSMFFPRQIPGHGNMFISTITGHHDHAKGGALCLFDVSKGRREADGALQLILGRGKKVEPLVIDGLSNHAYSPKFFEPYPLSDKYFLTQSGKSIYLVDTFNNMLLLAKGPYCEPVPLMKRKTPRVIPDRIKLTSKDATVMITDIYEGRAMVGVARGTVKAVRVYRYEYGPRHKGGHYSMGMEAGWDAKQILGTAPVEADGSASFKVPANTPFAMQPLDKDGKALALMRSWTVAMPGEMLSCIGCHESQNMAPPMKRAAALRRAPSVLTPFYGPARGFSFAREVQPVLQKHCVSCHDGKHDVDENGRDKGGRYTIPDRIVGTGSNTGKSMRVCGIPNFSTAGSAYTALHPYVRRNGPEGDYHGLIPLEFHVDTSELFQMLEKGHHGVKLDKAAWDRLITWADLNAPFKGSWTEAGANKQILARRMELRKLYAFDNYNPEKTVPVAYVPGGGVTTPMARKEPVETRPPHVQGYEKRIRTLDLGNDIKMEFARIPAGIFSMGSNDETPLEQPVTRVQMRKAFYMGTKEVTLKQFRQFDPDYLNGVYDMHYKDQVHRGYYMNVMDYPVIRVSWQKANEFCKWLSKKSGKKVLLPTEAQWEWACRAGTQTALSYGDVNAVFSKYANMADVTVKLMAVKSVNPRPIPNPSPTLDFELKDPRSDDGVLHLAKVGSYQPNAWGLYDMHGNAAEWTRSDYRPYPYSDTDGRNAGSKDTKKVVRGGSWHDRPFRSTSSYRLGFPTWQRVYHVGFRVVVEP